MINISFWGDFVCDGRIPKQMELYPNKILADFKDVIDGCSFNVVNLESPIAYQGMKGIIKEGPSVSSPEIALKWLKEEGFNVLTLANNHILDYGDDGIRNTLEKAEQYGLRTIGAGNNIQQARKVLCLEHNGLRIAIINACEQEFSIATESHAGANPINEIHLYNDIQSAKEEAEYVFVVIHGGHEYYQLPSPRMKSLYHFFIDAGANAVVAHHPHCFSGYEKYNDGIIFYSLGNFLFDLESPSNLWFEGFGLTLKLKDGKIDCELHPYVQCKEEPVLRKMNEEENDKFNKRMDELNEIILDDKKLISEFENFAASHARQYMSRVLPYSSHILVALYKRGWFPSFISKNKIVNLANALRCEAHRDVLAYLLGKKLN